METAPNTAPVQEETNPAAEDETEELYERTVAELAEDLATTLEETGADAGRLSLVFPEGHPLYGYKVAVEVEAEYEECDEDEAEAEG